MLVRDARPVIVEVKMRKTKVPIPERLRKLRAYVRELEAAREAIEQHPRHVVNLTSKVLRELSHLKGWARRLRSDARLVEKEKGVTHKAPPHCDACGRFAGKSDAVSPSSKPTGTASLHPEHLESKG